MRYLLFALVLGGCAGTAAEDRARLVQDFETLSGLDAGELASEHADVVRKTCAGFRVAAFAGYEWPEVDWRGWCAYVEPQLSEEADQ